MIVAEYQLRAQITQQEVIIDSIVITQCEPPIKLNIRVRIRREGIAAIARVGLAQQAPLIRSR